MLTHELFNPHVPLVGKSALFHVILATDVFRGLHIERSKIFQHLLELLHKLEVLVHLFRTFFLFLTIIIS